MEFDQSTPRIVNGILLLDYFADPQNIFPISNSLDTNFIKILRAEEINNSKRSRPSSYSGSKYEMSVQSSRVKKVVNAEGIINSPKVTFYNIQKDIVMSSINQEKESSEISLSNSIKQFASKVTKELFSNAFEKLNNEANEDEESNKFEIDDKEYSSQNSLIHKYIDELYSKAYNNL